MRATITADWSTSLGIDKVRLRRGWRRECGIRRCQKGSKRNKNSYVHLHSELSLQGHFILLLIQEVVL